MSDDGSYESDSILPYDSPPEEYASAEEKPSSQSLASRITNSRVYLLADSANAVKSNLGKLKGVSQANGIDEQEDAMDVDNGYRTNALLLQGPPISHLPTDRVFAYVTQFAPAPLGLEWVDDQTCVIVYESASLARAARRFLLKDHIPESDISVEDVGALLEAQEVSPECWPAKASGDEDAENALRSEVSMRWAKPEDVKDKGAGKKSRFYERYGESAGKEGYRERGTRKRKRDGREDGEGLDKRRELDAELDAYLAKDEAVDPTAPAGPDHRSSRDLAEEARRAALDAELDAFLSKDTDSHERSRSPPPPRRSRYESDAPRSFTRSERESGGRGRDSPHRRGRRRQEPGGRRGEARPRVGLSQLDAELDAYLKSV